jgi:hypothetical protein
MLAGSNKETQPRPSDDGAKRSPPKRPRAKQKATPAQAAPDAGAPLYVLSGGGRGQGKQAYSGLHANFVGRHTVDGVCTAFCTMQLPDGQRVLWARTCLRELPPHGAPVAEEPPSWAALMLPAATARAARATPGVPIIVLFDLEARGGSVEMGPLSFRITELSAIALQHGRRRRGAAWEPCHEMLSLRVRKGASFLAAARKLNEWLQAVAPAAADGAGGLILTAHNGPGWDWPMLTAHLTARGMQLPACVSLLACSGPLFMAGKEQALRGRWAMRHIYMARFKRAVPNAHTADGDVR